MSNNKLEKLKKKVKKLKAMIDFVKEKINYAEHNSEHVTMCPKTLRIQREELKQKVKKLKAKITALETEKFPEKSNDEYVALRDLLKEKNVENAHLLIEIEQLKENSNATSVFVPQEFGRNRYGVDVGYFRNAINSNLNIKLENYTPTELATVFARLAITADSAIFNNLEFFSKGKDIIEKKLLRDFSSQMLSCIDENNLLIKRNSLEALVHGQSEFTLNEFISEFTSALPDPRLLEREVVLSFSEKLIDMLKLNDDPITLKKIEEFVEAEIRSSTK